MRLLAIFTHLLAVTAASARKRSKREVRERQLEASMLWQTSWEIDSGRAGDMKSNAVQNITFTNPKASGE